MSYGQAMNGCKGNSDALARSACEKFWSMRCVPSKGCTEAPSDRSHPANMVDAAGNALMCVCALNNHTRTLQFLVQDCALPTNVKNGKNELAEDIAVKRGHWKCVEILSPSKYAEKQAKDQAAADA